MRTLWLLSILMVTGCEGTMGSVGPQGPEGPPGAMGPRGEPGGVYVWVDADGKEVDTDSNLVWTDVNGWQWRIDTDKATASHSYAVSGGYYENSDCTGEWYMAGDFRPRWVIRRADGTYWVRGDTTVATRVVIRSFRVIDEAACQPYPNNSGLAYSLIKIDGLVPPGLPYRAPLRLQRR